MSGVCVHALWACWFWTSVFVCLWALQHTRLVKFHDPTETVDLRASTQRIMNGCIIICLLCTGLVVYKLNYGFALWFVVVCVCVCVYLVFNDSQCSINAMFSYLCRELYICRWAIASEMALNAIVSNVLQNIMRTLNYHIRVTTNSSINVYLGQGFSYAARRLCTNISPTTSPSQK